MAQLQNGLSDQGMPPLETCSLQGSAHGSGNAGPLQLRGPLLWEDIFHLETKEEERADEGEGRHRQEAVERWGKILPALGRFCEQTQLDGSSAGGGQFSPSGIEEALISLHREPGISFSLDPGTEARCLHVAGIVSLNCLLILMGMYGQNKDASAIAEHSDLSGELSKVSDKWKWSGDACKHVFNEWIRNVPGCADSEEAMKLLYQWTLLPLLAVLFKVELVMDDANVCGGDQYTVVKHVSKWSDELCNFLKEYRTLFEASEDTEFFYFDHIYKFLRRTALLHRMMGNEKRTTGLLEWIKCMLEGIWDNKLMITYWGTRKIAYIKPNPFELLDRMIDVRDLLIVQLEGIEDYEHLRRIKEERNHYRNIRDELGAVAPLCYLLDWSTSLYRDQIYLILSAFGFERINEARELFKQIDLENHELKARFREFLYSAHIGALIRHSCSGSKLKWKSLREKQDFLLDVCEALGDRQLIAKYSQYCGWMMYQHSYDIFEDIKDAPTYELRLKEELSLQLTSSTPECAQELISCLNDPCKSDEHRRDNLPDMLKGLRLIKRSIDIYSDLLHNWTQSVNEVEWLMLLESQKGVHNMMLAFHLRILDLCRKCLIMNCKVSAVDRHDHHNLLCMKPTENALYLGSNPSLLALRSASSVLFKSTVVWAERGRARTLLHQLGRGDGPYPDALKEELIEFHNNQQAALSSILSCRSACKGDSLFVEYLSKISSPSIEPKQNLADAIVIHKHGTALQPLNTCNVDEVEELVNEFYETVPKQRRDAGVVVKLHSILEKLYDMLLEPVLTTPDMIQKHLDSSATLVIVPDKTLYRVPFALLRDKKTQKYLFQLHPIAIAPSLRVLQHCERRLRDLDNFPLKPEGCILGVGNAAYDTNRLPGTGEELELLQSCFPGRVKTLENDEATLAKFLELVKEACYSKEQHVFACIHLGVHGHWSKIGPRDMHEEEIQFKTGSLQFAKPPDQCTGGSKYPNITDASTGDLIVMARCQTSVQILEQEFMPKAAICTDGERLGSSFGEIGAGTRAGDFKSTAAEDMLPSEDIVRSGIQWRTRLVVLSACNSSRGQDYSDGEVNLPRALMIAGVPAAVVSQWKVEDSASPMLMKAFYENLQYGQDVATALQSAMLQLSNPESKSADMIFEWGPFLVWGLPNVQLPKELWTENARKTLPARQQSELLRCKLNAIAMKDITVKVKILEGLKTVDNLLASASCNACAPGEEAIIDAIIVIGEVLWPLSRDHYFSEEIIALAEEFYAVILSPLEQLKGIELKLEKRSTRNFVITFWHIMRFMQARKGSHETALDYDRKICEAPSANQTLKSIERAVILRLMGKYEEALKEFDGIYESYGEDYEYLIQMSYLMNLMEDKSGALEYACRAKKLEGNAESNCPCKAAFRLGLKALPDEYRQWLLGVDESGRGTSNSVWGVLPVQFPEKLLTQNAREALAGIELAQLLKWKLDRFRCDHKVMLVEALNAVVKFLASVYSTCALEEVVFDTILNIEILLLVRCDVNMFKELNALAEIVYTLVPFDQLMKLDHEYISRHYRDHRYFVLIRTRDTLSIRDGSSEKRGFLELDTIPFRLHVMYTQAMHGSHQIALDYANTLLEVIKSAYGCGHDESIVRAFREKEGFIRQEKAVILRLMGKCKEALKEFNGLRESCGEDYEYLIQMSYLMYLMEDKSGAMEYARKAKQLESPQLSKPDYGDFCLGYKALPDQYRQWIWSVDKNTGATSFSV